MLYNRILIVFFCLIVLPGTLFAQTKDEKEVAQAVETLKNGLISGDRKVLNNIAAPQLSYGHSSGLIEDKAAFVEALASGKSDFEKIDLSNQKISIVGNNAIVRHNLVADLKSNGVASNVNLGVLLVWQKQNGQWKLLARQAFKN